MLAITLLAGALIRLGLFRIGLHGLICLSPQFSTPLSSIVSVREGSFLLDAGLSPYEGDYYHGSPLMLIFLHPFLDSLLMLALLFTSIDVIIAVILFKATEQYQCVRSQEDLEESKIIDSLEWDARTEKNSLGKHDCRTTISVKDGAFSPPNLPGTVAAVYLLNPFTILCCIAMNVNVLTHLAIVTSLYLTLCKYDVVAVPIFALAVHLQIYPAVLLIPLTMLIAQLHSACSDSVIFVTVRTIFVFVVATSLLLLGAQACVPQYTIKELIYLSFFRMLSLPDLKPNVGIWWYFFMETFERFRGFFLVVFHVHPLILMGPLCFQFHARPVLLAQALLSIVALFKPYADMSDIAFTCSMFFMHPWSIVRINSLLLIGVGIVVPSCIMPLMWYMWLTAGTGNANFYYFQNLILLLFLVFFVSLFVNRTIMRDRIIKAYKKRNK